MTDNQPGRRPLGPPPTSLNSAPEPAPVPPETQAGATPSAWKKAVPVVAAGVLAVLLWPMVSSKFSEQFSGSDEPADTPVAARDESVYDFTYEAPEDAPLGPLDEVTIKVPESLAAVVPGYADTHYLDSVTVSNVQHLEYNKCTVDIAFDWRDGAVEGVLAEPETEMVRTPFSLDQVEVEVPGDRRVMELVGLEDFVGATYMLAIDIADDWSLATITTECSPPAQSYGGLFQKFSLKFGYTRANGLGVSEPKILAGVSVRVFDNGKFFIHSSGVNGWGPSGDGRWVEVHR